MNITLNIDELIIPRYQPILDDILDHHYTHYIFSGGRGSTKSSFVGEAVIFILLENPTVHAAVFRKIGRTLQNSVYGQIVWSIYKMGLEKYFKIPKTIANPIVFTPTGQQIMFFGLDDPMKVKSIKLPFGYVGITWFEELDQFNGEAELRNVLQSTMRGGDLFWNFCSFNPPISMNNWANEYADYSQDREDTEVIHNTYLDVPEHWLGPQFIQEAEILKEINYRAYQHEYLGLAIGTGGTVFPNVEDFDMQQQVDVSSPYDLSPRYEPLWRTFDKIYTGLDWGFSIDPTRLVRCHFDSTRLDLYIFYEYNTVATRNQFIYEEIYNCENPVVHKDDLIIADSAEPKSIADFKAYGAHIRGAQKGPESVRYGIKWLQGLRHIYIDRRLCPKTYQEFTTYEYMQDKDGNFVSEVPDENNHSIDAVRYALERWWKRRGK